MQNTDKPKSGEDRPSKGWLLNGTKLQPKNDHIFNS